MSRLSSSIHLLLFPSSKCCWLFSRHSVNSNKIIILIIELRIIRKKTTTTTTLHWCQVTACQESSHLYILNINTHKSQRIDQWCISACQVIVNQTISLKVTFFLLRDKIQSYQDLNFASLIELCVVAIGILIFMPEKKTKTPYF